MKMSLRSHSKFPGRWAISSFWLVRGLYLKSTSYNTNDSSTQKGKTTSTGLRCNEAGFPWQLSVAITLKTRLPGTKLAWPIPPMLLPQALPRKRAIHTLHGLWIPMTHPLILAGEGMLGEPSPLHLLILDLSLFFFSSKPPSIWNPSRVLVQERWPRGPCLALVTGFPVNMSV